jgi:CheY-like chemotaxis protein
MFTMPGVTKTCPACSGSFALGPPRRRNTDTLRRVSCEGCGRATVVTNSHAARILIVEPVEAARASVCPMLRDAGHEVNEAVDIAEGLASYRATASDVVIVDVSEGTGMSGPRFISRLRDEFPTAAVVALSRRTSYGVGDRSSIASHLGAVTVRRMPCSPAEMLESIETARKAEV